MVANRRLILLFVLFVLVVLCGNAEACLRREGAPPVIVVETNRFAGAVEYGTEYLIRLQIPLPASHRWEIDDATFDGDEGRKPLAVTAADASPNTFLVTPWGRRARVVFVQRRDGWQLFPETVTLDLTVEPVPKC